jgi:dTMP kinase
VPARFVTLEGGEGVGKSTQAKALAEALRALGLEVEETREPGGSSGAEAIRALLLGGEVERWDSRTEALLFAAARADHVRRTIRPALEQGRWVLCDRFVDSSIVYQGIVGEVGADAVLRLHEIGSGGLMPDRTLLLHLDGAEAAARGQMRDGQGADRFGARDRAYHLGVAAGFEQLVREEPDRVRQVDASGPAQSVTARLLAALEDLL